MVETRRFQKLWVVHWIQLAPPHLDVRLAVAVGVGEGRRVHTRVCGERHREHRDEQPRARRRRESLLFFFGPPVPLLPPTPN